ncbi:hypothetical protein ACRTDU_06185 [Sunxiuqinia elliptica]|jgi:hypothetical protein
MKKTTLTFSLLMALCMVFTSCSKDDDEQPEQENYAPGEIPGLGDASGELTGAPFNLPQGIELLDEIEGFDFTSGYWNFTGGSASLNVQTKKAPLKNTFVQKSVRTKSHETYHYFGSGCNLVDLLIPMTNNNSVATTVNFPAGTILKSRTGDTQNGVLIKKVSITIPAKTDYYLYLSFYCGNANRDAAGTGDVYDLGVVSNAHPIIVLCNKVKNKKINIEDFSPELSNYMIYTTQAIRLQDIIWSITDGEGMSEEDISYINSLPNS